MAKHYQANGQDYEFPDNMPDDIIEDMIRKDQGLPPTKKEVVYPPQASKKLAVNGLPADKANTDLTWAEKFASELSDLADRFKVGVKTSSIPSMAAGAENMSPEEIAAVEKSKDSIKKSPIPGLETLGRAVAGFVSRAQQPGYKQGVETLKQEAEKSATSDGSSIGGMVGEMGGNIIADPAMLAQPELAGDKIVTEKGASLATKAIDKVTNLMTAGAANVPGDVATGVASEASKGNLPQSGGELGADFLRAAAARTAFGAAGAVAGAAPELAEKAASKVAAYVGPRLPEQPAMVAKTSQAISKAYSKFINEGSFLKRNILTGHYALEQSGQVGQEASALLKDTTALADSTASKPILNLFPLIRMKAEDRLKITDVLEGRLDPTTVDPQIATLAATIKEDLSDVAKRAEQNGLMVRVWDNATQSYEMKPFVELENYFPHFRTDIEHTPVFSQQPIVKEMGTKSQNIRKQRTSGKGEYERDPLIALTQYYKEAYRDLSERLHFGNNLEKVQELVDKAELFGEDSHFLNDVMTRELGGGPLRMEGAGFANVLTAYQAATKMTKSGLGNLTQSAYTASQAGAVRTAKVMVKTAKDAIQAWRTGELSEHLENAYRTGAAIESMSRYLMPSGDRGWLGKVADMQLKYVFRPTETYNRLVAAATGREYAQDLGKVVLGEHVPWYMRRGGLASVDRAKADLTKLGIDVNEVVANGGLSEAQLERAGFEMSQRTQYGARPVDMPLSWSSSPWAKAVTQFRGVGLRMVGTLMKDVGMPALKGDLAPITRLAVAAGVLGGSKQAIEDVFANASKVPMGTLKAIDWTLNAITGRLSTDQFKEAGDAAAAQAVSGGGDVVEGNLASALYKDSKKIFHERTAAGKAFRIGQVAMGVHGRTFENAVKFAEPAMDAVGQGDTEPLEAYKSVKAYRPLIRESSAANAAVRNYGDDAAELVEGKPKPTPPGEFRGNVEEIVDGDTMLVRGPEGLQSVRLAEIDAPEHDQAGGLEAARGLAGLVGKPVTVKPQKTDDYDRIVAEVLDAQGSNPSMQQLKAGLAYKYPGWSEDETFMHRLKIMLAEYGARFRRTGIWGRPQDEAPDTHRHRLAAQDQ